MKNVLMLLLLSSCLVSVRENEAKDIEQVTAFVNDYYSNLTTNNLDSVYYSYFGDAIKNKITFEEFKNEIQLNFNDRGSFDSTRIISVKMTVEESSSKIEGDVLLSCSVYFENINYIDLFRIDLSNEGFKIHSVNSQQMADTSN